MSDLRHKLDPRDSRREETLAKPEAQPEAKANGKRAAGPGRRNAFFQAGC